MGPKRSATSAFKPLKQSTNKSASKAISQPKQSKSTKPAKKKARVPSPSSSEDEESESDDEISPSGSQADEGSTSASAEDDSDSDSTPQPISRSNVRSRPSANTARAVRNTSPTRETEDEVPPVVPEKLLTALLYSHFQKPDTKIGRDARGLVGKYVETFIREAVARAVVERKGGAGAEKSGGGDFLEVEDLEKLAPQLILDF